MIRPLPPASSISPSVSAFLDSRLSTQDDLSQAPAIVSELQEHCHGLDDTLSELNKQFENLILDYVSDSQQISDLLSDISNKLIDLQLSADSSVSSSDGGSEKVLGEELPALAKEVARVETVRMYAETALKLDTLVGDIEDAVSSTVNRTLRRHPSTKNAEEMRLVAIRTLKSTEDVLNSVAKTRPQWMRLVSAVDHRVDRALAILRPQAIADHRALLASLGWPPPLSSLNSSSMDAKKSAHIDNPLFTMQGELKQQYCESFHALCSLQELQRRRKFRQLVGHHQEVALGQPLWAIEELVNPVFIVCQRHFSKWTNKPEFIFALVYKITRDYVDSMDELLQPLVDEAMLSGYSCREEWISAMVTSLSTYLAKEIFPIYIDQMNEESATGVQSQARVSWLNLIDLMIAFDKRVQSLLEHGGVLPTVQEDGNLQKISPLSLFCDRPDWLDLWVQLELTDIFDKLKSDIEDERVWSTKVQGATLLSGQENIKSPVISSVFLQHLSSVVDRCRSLPSISLRLRFLRLTGIPVIQKFIDCILFRCQEAEGLTALTDDDSLTKVANSVNAARYFESVIKEWCEDVFFLEMGTEVFSENASGQGSEETPESGVFDIEIRKLEVFRMEWVEKLTTVILRGFDACCRDYVKNRKQWQEKGGEGWSVTRSFVGALDYLQAKMSILEAGLNGIDFIGVWRNLAAGVDRLLFTGIIMSSAKFSDMGVERLGNDLSVLYGVFGAWCLRPEGFFPKVTDGLKLLKMGKKQLKSTLVGSDIWLKENGIRHLTAAETEKIAKNRLFTS